MTLATILAMAANEPWCIPPDVAAKLSVHQLAAIVIGPDRDHLGRVETPATRPNEVEPDARTLFDLWAEANKVPRWRADQLWRDRCRMTR